MPSVVLGGATTTAAADAALSPKDAELEMEESYRDPAPEKYELQAEHVYNDQYGNY